jgi:hypothetical protein
MDGVKSSTVIRSMACPPLALGERQQQAQRVPIAGLGIAREIALGHQVLQEEAPDPGPDKLLVIHDGSPIASNRQSGGSPPGGVPASFADNAEWT